jgi:hypothetical protein
MTALLGDPDAEGYELLFSFSSQKARQRFVDLMQSNALTKNDPETMMVPSAEEIRDAKPLGLILDEDIMRHVNTVAIMVTMGSGSETVN